MSWTMNKLTRLKTDLPKSNILIIKKITLNPKEIWFLSCKSIKDNKFSLYIPKAFGFAKPKQGFATELEKRKIINVNNNLYILINYSDEFNVRSLKKISDFGEMHNFTSGLRILKIKGRDSGKVVNRLLEIDAEKMKKGQICKITIFSQTGYLIMINQGEYELIFPYSYLIYIDFMIKKIVSKLEKLKQSEIQLISFI